MIRHVHKSLVQNKHLICEAGRHLGRPLTITYCLQCGRRHDSSSADGFRRKRKEMREEEAKKALDNISSALEERFQKIKMEVEILGASNIKAPDPTLIKAHEWLYMLQALNTEKERRNYMLTLGLRQRHKETPRVVIPDQIVEEGVCHSKASTRIEDFRKAKAVQGMVLGNPVILDLDYDMPESEERRMLSLFLKTYSAHAQHLQPFRLIVTGVKNRQIFKRELEKGGSLEFVLAEFYDQSFEELFSNKRLVYLSPDSRYCSEYYGDCVYVIGGLTSSQDNTQKSASKAKQLGVRTVGIPIKKHVRMTSNAGHNLQIDTVYKILLDVNLHHSWRYALVQNLPGGKYSPIKEEKTIYFEAGDDILVQHQ